MARKFFLAFLFFLRRIRRESSRKHKSNLFILKSWLTNIDQ
nr:MAG TPA: hypothetical protein [Caudoviricetes sp.]DAK46426.1 MAG TPA: hypothetical protein [Bacteriophage sp.]DAK46245.1 MAG TPA: hypothetical protein [Caudoviricetes sp.]DAT20728.1 MAG TPA: hypothetical protein [Caudoviricetes sp.]DAT76907.1 MAG TPA: hypothetical protein [Caudoviricetes sp.]